MYSKQRKILIIGWIALLTIVTIIAIVFSKNEDGRNNNTEIIGILPANVERQSRNFRDLTITLNEAYYTSEKIQFRFEVIGPYSFANYNILPKLAYNDREIENPRIYGWEQELDEHQHYWEFNTEAIDDLPDYLENLQFIFFSDGADGRMEEEIRFELDLQKDDENHVEIVEYIKEDKEGVD